MEPDPAARIAALEAELARARAEAEVERERLERRLKLAQTALPERRDPRTVTQNIAAQQEIDALRGALRERDRIVKELTAQVRRLEDDLEDHYRRADVMRRQLSQREDELAEARGQAEAAARRAASIQAPPPQRIQQPKPLPAPPSSPERADAVTFVVGVFVGILLACAVGVGLWWTGRWPVAPDAAAFGKSVARAPALAAAWPVHSWCHVD
jgi:hypothetical protein